MSDLQDRLNRLPARHREALSWFVSNAGSIQDWPEPLTLGGEPTLLAIKPKGIYKPEWTEYTLSVRQTMEGPYADKEPIHRADGTWSYPYFQENPDPAKRDDAFTNRGLMACMRDGVPVGVMRQVSGKPHVQYRVLGVAVVSHWDAGLFFLEGFAPDGHAQPPGPATEVELLSAEVTKAEALDTFDPKGIIDGRRRTIASIVRRRGQAAFRDALLKAYEGRCAITGCDAAPALEAAHITPYLGTETNHPANGLLLRGDLHTLFDLGLIAVDEEMHTVLVAPSLANTSYAELAGVHLRQAKGAATPSKAALLQHRLWACL